MNNDNLIKLYKTDPCRFHASSLWKTLVKDDLQKDISIDNDGINQIKLYNDSVLFLFWNKQNDYICNYDEFNVALLHHTQVNSLNDYDKKYFRLKYNKQNKKEFRTDYSIKEVDIIIEKKLVAEFINDCYQDMHNNESDIISWIKHPVFDKNLWIWVTDKETGEYLGLGIAEYDKDIKEGSLEWIQVSPNHVGKGVGSVIVNELVKRMKHADFITVSGETNNPAAEKLYRSCGFEGNDIWCVFKK